jgi:allantoicase
VIEDKTPVKINGAFVSKRHRYNSWTERRARKADARKWHLRLGHPGPQALEHLVNTSRGQQLPSATTVLCLK